MFELRSPDLMCLPAHTHICTHYIYTRTQPYKYINTYTRAHMHMRIHITTRIHIYAYMHRHINAHTHLHTYTCTHAHTHIYMCTHAYMHVHTYTHTHVNTTYTYAHTYICTQTNIHIHTHMHMCTHLCVQTYLYAHIHACTQTLTPTQTPWLTSAVHCGPGHTASLMHTPGCQALTFEVTTPTTGALRMSRWIDGWDSSALRNYRVCLLWQ